MRSPYELREENYFHPAFILCIIFTEMRLFVKFYRRSMPSRSDALAVRPNVHFDRKHPRVEQLPALFRAYNRRPRHGGPPCALCRVAGTGVCRMENGSSSTFEITWRSMEWSGNDLI